MIGNDLTLIVCGAPLAARTGDLVTDLMKAGWRPSVVATPAAMDWLGRDIDLASDRLSAAPYVPSAGPGPKRPRTVGRRGLPRDLQHREQGGVRHRGHVRHGESVRGARRGLADGARTDDQRQAVAASRMRQESGVPAKRWRSADQCTDGPPGPGTRRLRHRRPGRGRVRSRLVEQSPSRAPLTRAVRDAPAYRIIALHQGFATPPMGRIPDV